MRQKRHLQPDRAAVTYPWALIALVCAVYFPLFRSHVTVFGDNVALFEWWLGPAASHAVNVLLHGVTSLLVYHVGRRLLHGATVAFWAALLFAIHPVHVDAVARVPGWIEPVSALLVLALLLFALERGALADTSALRVTSVLSAAFLWLALRAGWWYLAGRGDQTDPLLSGPPGTLLMTGVNVLGRNLKLLVWPFRLSPDYSYNSIPAVLSPLSAAFMFPLLCILTLLVLAAMRVRLNDLYLVSSGFLLICAFPVWGLRLPVLAERWLYFPSAAFCWMLASLFRDAGLAPRLDWHDRRFVRSALLLVVFLAVPWSAKTYLRSRQWEDEKVLLQQAAATVPGNARIQSLLGQYYERQGDYLGAQRSYRRALEVNPACEEAGLKLAAAYRQAGMYDRALATAQGLTPSRPRTKALRAAEIGRDYFAMNDYARAAAAFEQSLRYTEADASVHRELGMLYLHFLGEPDRGRSHLRRSAELDGQ